MRSDFTETDAARLARELYGIEGTAHGLDSYSDQNFRIRCEDGRTFVLKFANSDEPEPEIDFQVQALRHLERTAPDLNVPRLIETRAGKTMNLILSQSGRSQHVAWMVSFLPGKFVAERSERTPELQENLGRFMGVLDASLKSYSHPAMHRFLQWDLKQAADLQVYLQYLFPGGKRKLIERGLDRFERCVYPKFSSLPTSVIHNDANDNNVLTDGHQAMGIIDFGDMVHTYTVCEIAIAITYMMLGEEHPLEIAGRMLAGYREAYPLSRNEVEVLFDLIYLRLCTSVCMSALERTREPDNDYLGVSERPAWDMLEYLAAIDPDRATALIWG